MASNITGIKFSFRDTSTDKPLSFGKVYAYESGTTSPKNTWSDEDKTALNTNPVILDAYGQADICLEGKYRLLVTDASDVPMDIIDPISDSATQAKDFVGDLSGFGTCAIKDVGEEYGDVMMISNGSWFGKSAPYPDPLAPLENDLDDLPLVTKLYHGTALVNAPTAGHIQIFVQPTSDGKIVQEVTELSTGLKWTRYYNGTSWSVWTDFVTVDLAIQYAIALS